MNNLRKTSPPALEYCQRLIHSAYMHDPRPGGSTKRQLAAAGRFIALGFSREPRTWRSWRKRDRGTPEEIICASGKILA